MGEKSLHILALQPLVRSSSTLLHSAMCMGPERERDRESDKETEMKPVVGGHWPFFSITTKNKTESKTTEVVTDSLSILEETIAETGLERRWFSASTSGGLQPPETLQGAPVPLASMGTCIHMCLLTPTL